MKRAMMQIFVKTFIAVAKTITLNVNASDTIARVKAKIHEQEGIPVALICLVRSGVDLEDGLTLTDYNIQNNNSVHMVALPPASSSSVTVWIMATSRGSSRWLAVQMLRQWSVRRLKHTVWAVEGTPPNQQRLTYYDDELENDRTLAAYDFHSNDAVWLEVLD